MTMTMKQTKCPLAYGLLWIACFGIYQFTILLNHMKQDPFPIASIPTTTTTTTTTKQSCWNNFKPMTQPTTMISKPTGLVVTLLLTSHDETYQQALQGLICNAIPSQYTHLYEPQGWDLLLMIASNKSKDDSVVDTQSITMMMMMDMMTNCWNHTIRLQSVMTQQQQQDQQEWNNLDGSTVTTTKYTTIHGRHIYIGTTHLEYPLYIQKHPQVLKQTILPQLCNAPKSYIQGTRWYSNEMLHLAILKEYDYFIKLDLDIYFIRTLPIDLLHDMSKREALFAHSAQIRYQSGTQCATGIVDAVTTYLNQSTTHSNYCSKQTWHLTLNTDLFYTNFIIGQVDFWTSPQVLHFSQFLSNHPTGFFTYRWTDQIMWHQALGLFVKDFLTKAVVDYTEFRCSPEINCWNAVFFEKIYSTPSMSSFTNCDNGGAFLHLKHATFQWNTTKSVNTLWKSNTELWNTSYRDDCDVIIAAKRKEWLEKKKKEKDTKETDMKKRRMV